MKKIILLFLVLASSSSFAQNQFKLKIYVSEGKKIGLYRPVYLTAYLINISDKALIISDPRHAEPLWNVYTSKWKMTTNGKEKIFNFGFDLPHSSMKKGNLVSLNPKDSIVVSSLFYDKLLDEEGKYTFSLTHSQNKAKADPNYVDPKLLENNQDFSLTSNTLTVNLNVPNSVAGPALTLEEIEAIPDKVSNMADALENPNKAYYISLNKYTKTDIHYLLKLKNLRILELEGDLLDTIPEAMADLKLVHLTIKGKMKELVFPKNFCKSQTLTHLETVGVAFKEFPEWLLKQKDLNYLNMSSTEFINLPESFGDLIKIKYLALNYSKFTSLPNSFHNLTSLQTLYIKGGHLKNIDNLKDLPLLKEAYFTQSKIESVGNQLGTLPSLTKLYLWDNMVGFISPDVTFPKSLKILQLSENKLTEVPPALFMNHELESLLLSKNQIKSLPNVTANFANLQGLSLNTNSLTELPQWLLSMPKLKWINIEKNGENIASSQVVKDLIKKKVEVTYK